MIKVNYVTARLARISISSSSSGPHQHQLHDAVSMFQGGYSQQLIYFSLILIKNIFLNYK